MFQAVAGLGRLEEDKRPPVQFRRADVHVLRGDQMAAVGGDHGVEKDEWLPRFKRRDGGRQVLVAAGFGERAVVGMWLAWGGVDVVEVVLGIGHGPSCCWGLPRGRVSAGTVAA